MSGQSNSDWRPAIWSAAAALVVYAVTLAGTYVYDDRYIVQLDPRVSDTSLWSEYWTKDYFNGGADNLYRPLVSMTYAIETKLHGNDERHAWIFHLVNILLHAGVAAAVAELARRMTGSSVVALSGGILFAVHPIHVEAVANIVGRAELMCGLGMMLALVLFLRPMTVGRAIAIWLCFLLALLSKEQGMLVPLLLVLAIPLRNAVGARPASPASAPSTDEVGLAPTSRDIISYAQPDTPRGLRFTTATWTLILLLLWTLAGYILFRERILKFWWDRSFLDPIINPMLLAKGIDRWLLPVEFLGRYVALMVAPLHQSPDYGGRVIGWSVRLSDPYLHLGLVTLIAAVVACVLAGAQRAWATLLCLVSAGLLFGMVSNFVSIIGANFAARLMYIPSAFLCILAAMAIARLPRRVAMTAVTVLALLFAMRTVTYAWEWNDRLRLYARSAGEWPTSVRLKILLAEEWAERADLVNASRIIADARHIQPDYYKVWLRSATIALQAGNLEDALRFARRAHELQPTIGSAQLISEISQRLAATQPAPSPPATTRSATIQPLPSRPSASQAPR